MIKRLLLMLVLVCSIGIAMLSAATGPILSLPMNGNANDVSGNGYNGIVPASGVTPAKDRFGAPNSAYLFDGTGYIGTTATQVNVTQYSVSAWVKMNAGEYGSIITNRNDSNSECAGIIFDITNVGCIRMGANGPKYLRSAHANGQPIWDGRWHHVVGVFNCPNGTEVTDAHFTLYIDNVKMTGLEAWNIGTAKIAPLSGYGFTRIGEWDDQIGTPTAKTKGTIDDVRIYERALTQDDITALYYADGYMPQTALNLNNETSIESSNAEKYASVPEGAWFKDDFTVETWINIKSNYNKWERILDFGNGQASNNILLTSTGADGKPVLSIYDAATPHDYPFANALPVGWTHLAITYSAGTKTASVYYNGVFMQTIPNVFAPTGATTKYNYIGRSNWGVDSYLNAEIDEFRLYNIALTQAEIQDRSHKNLTGTEDGLVLYYDFDSVSGATVKNLAGATANADATVYNARYTYSKAQLTPFILPHSAISATGFTANWSNVTLAKNYELVYADNAAFANSTSIKVPENRFVFADLKQSSVFYKVRAITAIDTSQWASGEYMVSPGNALNLTNPIGTEGQYVQIPAGLNVNGDFTVDAWVNIKTLRNSNKWTRLFEFGNGPESNNILMTIDGPVTNTVSIRSGVINGTTPPPTSNIYFPLLTKNKWTHLAVTMAGDILSVYMDGKLVAQDKVPYKALDIARQFNYIGRSSWHTTYPASEPHADALFDEFRLYKKALTQEEIIARSHQKLIGNEDGLVLYYDFDQTSGSNVPNLAAKTGGFNATLMGGASRSESKALLTPFVRSVTEATLSSVKVNWDAVDGATKYEFVCADNAAFTDSIITIVTNNYASVNLSATKLYYKVRAITAQDASQWSSGEYMAPPGNAMTFNGSSAVKLPYSANYNPAIFTISLWAKPSKFTGDFQCPFGSRAESSTVTVQGGYNFYLDPSNKWTFWHRDADNKAWIGDKANGTSSAATLNKWTHLSATCDGATLRFYVDGVLQWTENTAAGTNKSFETFIGCMTSNAYYFNGSVDEISIWNKALGASEIISLSHTPYGQLSKDGLLAHFGFDQTTTTSVTESVTQSMRGAAIGTPTLTPSVALLTPFIRTVDTVKLASVVTKLTVKWDKIAGVTYEAAVANDASFTTITESISTKDTSAIVSINDKQKYYFMRLRAVTSAGISSEWQYRLYVNENAAQPNMAYVKSNALTIPNTTDIQLGAINDLTMSAWVNYSTPDLKTIFYQLSSGASTAGLDFSIEKGKLRVSYDAPAGQYLYSPVELAPNGWNHVAYTLKKGVVTMYINGNEYIPTIAIDNTTPSNKLLNAQTTGSTSPATIGSAGILLDNFQIWKSAIPQDSIIKYANTPVKGLETDLALAYNFNQMGGTQILDIASSIATNAVVNEYLPDWRLSNAELTPLVNFTNISDTTITANWSKVPAAASYKIEYATNEKLIGAIKQENITENNYVFPDATPATKYYFRIKSITATDSSSWSPVYVSATTSLNDSLIAYYPFNSTPVNDVTKIAATIVGSVVPASDRFGEAGKAYSFNGGYLNAGNTCNLDGDFTFCAWVNPTMLGTALFAKHLWNSTTAISGYLFTTIDDGSIFTHIGNGTVSKSNNSKGQELVLNQWQFITFQYIASDSVLRVYRNGIMQYQLESQPSVAANAVDFFIGQWNGGQSAYTFKGTMDDIRIFRRALSEKELTTLYHEGGWPYTGVTLADGNMFKEQQDAGTEVGTLEPIVAETFNPDDFTYSLISGAGATDNAKFSINGTTLKSAAILDYNTQKTASLRIRGENTRTKVAFERVLTLDILPNTETEVYTFDKLIEGDLNEQNGWSTGSGYTCTENSCKVMVAPATGNTKNTTLAIGHNTSGGNSISNSMSNLFPNLSFNDMSAQYTIGYDMYSSTWQTMFNISTTAGLAFKLNANQNNNATESLEILTQGSKSVSTPIPNEWVRVEMIFTDLDQPKAKISVRARTLATENSSWLQIVPPTEFVVDTVTKGALNNPASWTGINMYIESSGGQIDNLSFTKRTMNKNRSTINDGLIAWYKMDNSVEDASGNGLHGAGTNGSYEKMNYGFDGCNASFGPTIYGVTLEEMKTRAFNANALGFTYHPSLTNGALLIGSYPEGCESPATNSWPLYLLVKKSLEPAKDRFNEENSAYQFDGTNNFQVPGFGTKLNKDELTISVWTKTPNAANSIVNLSDDLDNNRLNVHIVPTVTFDYGNISSDAGRITSSPISIGTGWEHYVFVSSNSGKFTRIYKDNKLIAEKTGTHTFTPHDAALIIGGIGNSRSMSYSGLLDDMRIYGRALGEDEIASLYYEGGWPVQQIVLPSSLSVKVGTTQQLNPSVVPVDAPKDKLVYSSGNPSVATIDNAGLISAVSAGSVIVTATTENGSVSASTTVFVVADLPAITSVTIADSAKTLIVGQTVKLASSYKPRPAFTADMHWVSGNGLVASVANDGTVTALSKGSSVLYLYADKAEKIKDSCYVTVLPSQIPVVLSPAVAEYSFKATSQTNGAWDRSDTLRIDMAQFFADDDTLSYSFSPLSTPADTMKIRATGTSLTIFQMDTVPQIRKMNVTLTATDKDGQTASKQVVVTIRTAPDKAPVVDSVPVLPNMYQFRQTVSVNLANYLHDDYTPFDQLTYDSITVSNGRTLTIAKGIAKLELNLVDRLKSFKDTLAFRVVDASGLTTAVRIPFNYQFVVNAAPVSLYDTKDVLVQTSDTLIKLDVSKFVKDDYTPIKNIVWSVDNAANLNVALVGTELQVQASSSVWNGTEDIIVRAMDEAGAIGLITIPFHQEVSIALTGYPEVDFTITLSDGKPLPSILTRGTKVKATLENISANNSINISSWKWTFINADSTYTINGAKDQLIPLNNLGYFTVRLEAFNQTSGSSSGTKVTRKNVANIVGIVASKTLICGDSVAVLMSSDTTSGNQYQWSNGKTTASISVSPKETTNYTLKVTKDMADATDTVEIAVQKPISNIANDTIICGGQSQGVEFKPQGFSKIQWNDSDVSEANYTATAADTITVIAWIDDIGTCPVIKDTIVISVHEAFEIGLPDTLALCDGVNDTLIAKGGLLPTDYVWNQATNTGDTLVLTEAGLFKVTVTAANGCKYSDSTRVFENTKPAVSATTDRDTVCPGDTVQLTAQVATGIGFSWPAGVATDGTAVPTINGENRYIVTATSEYGCTATSEVTVVVRTAPEVSIDVASDSICSGSVLSLGASGANRYEWSDGISRDGSFIPKTTQRYFVTGYNAHECTDTASIIITVLDLPKPIIEPVDNSICLGDTIILAATGGETIEWDLGVKNGAKFAPEISNTYTVSVTDENKCVGKDSIEIEVHALPTIVAELSSNNICVGDSIQFNASGAELYVWDNDVETGSYLTFVKSGTFEVGVKGATSDGCFNTAKATFTVNEFPGVSIVDKAAKDTICKNSTVALFADGANSYVWSHAKLNGESFAPSATDTYYVTGTLNGCSATDSIKVFVSDIAGSSITLNTEKAFAVCKNQSVTLTASGLMTFEWNNGVKNGETFVPDTTTTYIVTGVDANKCISNESVTVTVNALPVISIIPANTTVCPTSRILLAAAGAATYVWDNNVEDGTPIYPTETKTYSVTGTDANGCAGSASTTIAIHETFAEQIKATTFRKDGSAIIVAWQATKGTTLSHYELKKFDDSISDYETIATVGKEDSTFVVDDKVSPQLQSYSYLLVSHDSLCPATEASSTVHTTIHLSKDLSTDPGSVGLKWSAYVGLDVKKYYIYAIRNGAVVDTIEKGVTDKAQQFYTMTYPNHQNGDRYQIAFDLPASFSANTLKSDSGPYSQSMSNLSEAIILSDVSTLAGNVDVYPVPAVNYIDVHSETSIKSCTVLDSRGEAVFTVSGTTRIDISTLPAGQYSLRIIFADGVVTKLFVK